jgi:hypothetical protein
VEQFWEAIPHWAAGRCTAALIGLVLDALHAALERLWRKTQIGNVDRIFLRTEADLPWGTAQSSFCSRDFKQTHDTSL